MMTRKLFKAMTVVVGALGFLGAAAVGAYAHVNERADEPRYHAQWKNVFRTTADLARGVDTIVLAKVVDVRDGRVAYSTNFEDSMAFQNVTLEVVRGLKGVRAGEQLVMERGAEGQEGGTSFAFDSDGGPVEVGQTYLLFLNRQEQGPYYYQVSDQGRFQLSGDTLLAVSPADEAARELNFQKVDAALGLLQRYLHTPP